ncbi:AlpA family phage regulatory protein [Bradyrhizobium sp. Leo170]|uniref:helix-turn-helix transcriptional regulator n=1 Tax=Bradyrhizobium sp. Leo170 TaxID=1571199 RepID=UPI00102E8AFF|nr:AlpA family phage regulatory protein [Bradyrhizobium sp. Leo170]TAI65691.1 hypothetical protein CWO89_12170 [Bradyrhizobium sp. Leo170]
MSAKARQQAAHDDGEKIELQQMITQEEVLERIPISRKSLDRAEKKGHFPKGRYVTPNRKMYFLAEVVQWQATVNEYNPNRGRGRNRQPRERAENART